VIYLTIYKPYARAVMRKKEIDIKQGKYFVEKETFPTPRYSLIEPVEAIGSNNTWIGFLDHLFNKLDA
jgi:hypothetical protein